jgi:hypothetical protein
MRAGNGKGLQPIIRERFSRPQDGFGATRILAKQGAQWLRTGQVPVPVSPDRPFGSPSCLRPAPLVPAVSLEPPPPPVPMFPCSHVPGAGRSQAGRANAQKPEGSSWQSCWHSPESARRSRLLPSSCLGLGASKMFRFLDVDTFMDLEPGLSHIRQICLDDVENIGARLRRICGHAVQLRVP